MKIDETVTGALIDENARLTRERAQLVKDLAKLNAKAGADSVNASSLHHADAKHIDRLYCANARLTARLESWRAVAILGWLSLIVTLIASIIGA